MVCKDIYSSLAPYLARYERGQIAVVYDRRLAGLPDLDGLIGLEGLASDGVAVSESVKSLETVTQLWDFFFAQGLTRRGLVIAVGGGVLTDTAGFAAATYKRGIEWLAVPTTLLAMTDASSGGKTGINYRGLKNSIGVFAPPVATLIWPGWLKTLPADQFLSGFGEMLKAGLIDKDGGLWNLLLQYDLDTMPIEPLTPLIEACVAVKERIVASDPREEGLRKTLNFGHTFGHALEEANGTWPHGYAVVYGMIAELYLSVVKPGCPREPLQQLTQLMLHYYGRPQCNCSDRERLIALMQQDKKNERAAEINCTLLRRIGEPVINQVIPPAEASEALDYLFSL